MLRAARLGARFLFTLEDRTRSQFDNAREAKVALRLAPRLRLLELRQLAEETEAAEAVKAMASAGLLEVFEPHLEGKLDLASLEKLDRYRRLVEQSAGKVDSFGLFLYCLARKLSSAERAKLRDQVGLPASEASAWAGLEKRAKALQKAVAGKQAEVNSRLFKTLASQDPAVALFLMAFSPLQSVRERVKSYFAELRPLAGSLNDKDLEDLGFKPGTGKFAAARGAYLALKLDGKIMEKADAAKLLAEYL